MHRFVFITPIYVFYLLLSAFIIPDAKFTTSYTEPSKIAPGLISTEMGEFSPAFDATTNELYFMRRTPRQFDYTIYFSTKTEEGWTKPEVAPFSGNHRDDAPYFSSDGYTLFFDSMRPHPDVVSGSINLWKTERTESGWSEPVLFKYASYNSPSEPDTGVDEYGPAIDEKGDLYFYSFRQPYRPGKRFKTTKSSNFQHIEPINDIPDPSANTFVSYIAFSTDGNTAILEGRHTGRRDTGLFYSCKDKNGSWGEAKLLPHVNSESSEGGPFLSSDGEFLFFASNRPATRPFEPNGNLFMISTEQLPIPCK